MFGGSRAGRRTDGRSRQIHRRYRPPMQGYAATIGHQAGGCRARLDILGLAQTGGLRRSLWILGGRLSAGASAGR
jgi:hypothetical protein